MARQLAGAVVVTTGASSGIGRATALTCAQQGAHLGLSARREWLPAELAAERTAYVVSSLAPPTDVSNETAVQRLASSALNAHGRIDVWVNNAGVSLYGRFEDSPPHAYRQVIETNLCGCIHGARAALPVFYERGKGTLINVASVQ